MQSKRLGSLRLAVRKQHHFQRPRVSSARAYYITSLEPTTLMGLVPTTQHIQYLRGNNANGKVRLSHHITRKPNLQTLIFQAIQFTSLIIFHGLARRDIIRDINWLTWPSQERYKLDFHGSSGRSIQNYLKNSRNSFQNTQISFQKKHTSMLKF